MVPAEGRAELDRVLAAEPFANAGRLSRLLRYLVDRTLADEGDQLKEYVLSWCCGRAGTPLHNGTIRSTVSPSAQASARPSIAVLPFQHFSTDEAHANVAAQITDSVTTELTGLGTIVVASRTSASHYTDGVRPLRDIAKALDGEFVMEASAVMQGPLQVRVVDGASDRTVWVGQYDSRPDELAGLTRRITSEASTAIQKISSRP